MSKQQDMTPPTSAEPPTDNNTDHGIPKVSPTARKKVEDVRDEDLFAYFFPDMASEDDDEAYVEWSQEIDRRNPLHVNSQGPQTEYFAKRAQRTLEFLRRMDNDDVVMAEHEAESARMKLEIEQTKLEIDEICKDIKETVKDINETVKESEEINSRIDDLFVMVDEKFGHLRKAPAGIDEERWLLSRKRHDEWVASELNETKRYRDAFEGGEEDTVDQRPHKKARR